MVLFAGKYISLECLVSFHKNLPLLPCMIPSLADRLILLLEALRDVSLFLELLINKKESLLEHLEIFSNSRFSSLNILVDSGHILAFSWR